METEDRLKTLLKAAKDFEEIKANERKMRSRAEANDKYNPKCPQCGLRVLYCIYGRGSDKIDYLDRQGILYRNMGCFIPQNRYTYVCPDCHIGFDKNLHQIND